VIIKITPSLFLVYAYLVYKANTSLDLIKNQSSMNRKVKNIVASSLILLTCQ
jgi:hypothetical protein